MRVLGIDPGLNVSGYAILEGTSARTPRVVDAGFIKTLEGRKAIEMAPRLRILYEGIIEIIDEFKPTAFAVEQLYAHYEHPRTAILMGHARGVIFLAAAHRKLEVTSYNSTTIKKTITGSGRASKEQMQYAMMRELKLASIPEPHDVADALAIAMCHYSLSRRTATDTSSSVPA